MKDACLCAEDLVLDQKSETCVSCPAGTTKAGDGCDCGTAFQGAVYVPEANVCGCGDASYLNTTAGRCEKCPDGTSPTADFTGCTCPAGQQFVGGKCLCESTQFLNASSGRCVPCGAGGRQDPANGSRCTCGGAAWDAEQNTCPTTKSRALSPGAVAGIIIAVLASAALIGLCAFRLLRRDLLKRAAMADLFEMKHDQFVV